MQLWNVIKIHAINANKERDGNKNNRNNGKYPHYFIQLGTDRAMINIEKVI